MNVRIMTTAMIRVGVRVRVDFRARVGAMIRTEIKVRVNERVAIRATVMVRGKGHGQCEGHGWQEYVKSRQLGYKTVRLCEDDDDDDDDDDDRGVDSALYPQSPEQEANLVRSLSEHLAFGEEQTTTVLQFSSVKSVFLKLYCIFIFIDSTIIHII